MQTLKHDLFYALRTLAKSPAYAAVTILTLALGIGANTAILSVVNGVLLRPLPYPRPAQLMYLSTIGGRPQFPVAVAEYLESSAIASTSTDGAFRSSAC